MVEHFWYLGMQFSKPTPDTIKIKQTMFTFRDASFQVIH